MIVAVKRGLEEKYMVEGRREGTRLQGWLQPPGRWQFLFIFVPSEGGRGSPLLSFPFAPSVLFSSLGSWILLPLDFSGFFFSPCFLDLRFFFAPPNLWLDDERSSMGVSISEFFVINIDDRVFLFYFYTRNDRGDNLVRCLKGYDLIINK